MNKKEQKTAQSLLKKIQSARPNEVVQFGQAYQCLTQGALNRKNAEITRLSK
jgi:hypothetical protein